MRKKKLSIFILILVLGCGLFFYLAYTERDFICPVSYKGDIVIRNDCMGEGHFGARRSGGRRTHKGIDLEAKVGNPVMAAGSGYVIKVGNHPRGYGKYIKMLHKDGYTTIYAHLSEVGVRQGERVRRWKVIGRIGKTGNASHKMIKPHLHFEIRKDGIAVDPMGYIGVAKE